MNKRLFIIVLILIFCISCSKRNSEKYYTGYAESFVIAYYQIDGIEIITYPGKNMLNIVVSGDESMSYGVLSENEVDKAKYQAKCQRYNDIGYNNAFIYGFGHIPNTFQNRDFVSIDVVSDSDWDEEHLANTSLNDIFMFCSSSPIKFIERGYKNEYEWDIEKLPPCFKNDFFVKYYGDPVFGLLSELTYDDFVLIGGGDSYRGLIGVLTPIKKPSISINHTLTVTLTDENGNELRASREAIYQ